MATKKTKPQATKATVKTTQQTTKPAQQPSPKKAPVAKKSEPSTLTPEELFQVKIGEGLEVTYNKEMTALRNPKAQIDYGTYHAIVRANTNYALRLDFVYPDAKPETDVFIEYSRFSDMGYWDMQNNASVSCIIRSRVPIETLNGWFGVVTRSARPSRPKQKDETEYYG